MAEEQGQKSSWMGTVAGIAIDLVFFSIFAFIGKFFLGLSIINSIILAIFSAFVFFVSFIALTSSSKEMLHRMFRS